MLFTSLIIKLHNEAIVKIKLSFHIEDMSLYVLMVVTDLSFLAWSSHKFVYIYRQLSEQYCHMVVYCLWLSI